VALQGDVGATRSRRLFFACYSSVRPCYRTEANRHESRESLAAQAFVQLRKARPCIFPVIYRKYRKKSRLHFALRDKGRREAVPT
jgi:hypothetical protein